MTILGTYESNVRDLNQDTIDKIMYLVANRTGRTETDILDDIRKVLDHFERTKQKLLEDVTGIESRVEDYFWSNSIKVYDRKDTGTANFFKTSEGQFVLNHDGNLYQIVKGEPVLRIGEVN